MDQTERSNMTSVKTMPESRNKYTGPGNTQDKIIVRYLDAERRYIEFPAYMFSVLCALLNIMLKTGLFACPDL